MMTWRKPSPQLLGDEAERLKSSELTYQSPDGVIPRGFNVDNHVVEVGQGVAAFETAAQAIRDWKMFPIEMATLAPSRQPIEVGRIAQVLFRAGPLWTANPCRIMQVIDVSDDEGRMFGFTYGTLPGHIENGIETFAVSWSRRSNVVTYSIRAISRPAHWLIWLGYPYTRMQQARFRRLSGKAMQAACSAQSKGQS